MGGTPVIIASTIEVARIGVPPLCARVWVSPEGCVKYSGSKFGIVFSSGLAAFQL